MDCIFCKIIKGEIPSKVVYKDDKIFAFHDINPQAPHHVLLIPVKHIPSLMEAEKEDRELLGYMMSKIPEIAKEAGMDPEGTRVVTNCGESAGQAVFHLHFHLLSGRSFSWPPG